MLEKASELPEYSETTRPDTYFKSGFRLGYHQAEKDFELTWEDIKTIDKLLNQCVDYSNPYQEVLKRFKDLTIFARSPLPSGGSSSQK